MAEQTSKSENVAALAEEFVERYRQGERPPLSEYVDKHPELADEIQEVFPALVMIEGLAPEHDASIVGGEPESAPQTSMVEQLGDYRILREVGRGGMGIVYEAEQVSLGRHVALKVLPQNLLTDDQQKRRFEREAKAAARLHHTNIVPVFGVGEHDGMHYYVMQFIQGLGLDEVLVELKRMQASSPSSTPSAGVELPVHHRGDVAAADVARSLLTGTLDERLSGDVDSGDGQDRLQPTVTGFNPSPSVERASRPDASTTRLAQSGSISLPGQSPSEITPKSHSKKLTYWQSVATMGVQVASALQHAHDQGIQHRDIKPSNLLLDLRGTVWVTDFGLAKTDDQQNITHTGDILGTLRYLPPEAFAGKADHRGDVYSLGITLYELVALKPAYKERDRNLLIKQVTQEAPPRLDKLNREIPRDLVTIVHKAIERDPNHRYRSGNELAEDLQRFIDDEPIRARRISLVERLARWSRHNKALAASLSSVVLLVLLVAVGSLMAARHFRALAQRNKNLADAAEAARAREETLKANAIEDAKQKTKLKELAEKSQQESRRQLYDSESSRHSYAGRSADQYASSIGHLERWKNESIDSRDYEYYRLQTQVQLPGIDLDCKKRGDSKFGKLLAVDWSPDGRRIVAGNTYLARASVEVYDALLGDRLWAIAFGDAVTTVDWSSDGRWIACGTERGAIVVIDPVTRRRLRPIQAHIGVRRVRWSHDGSWLVSCGDKHVKVWDAKTWKLIHRLDGHTADVIDVAFDADSRRIASCAKNGEVRIWEAASGKLNKEWQHDGNVAAWAWSLDAGQMAFVSRTSEYVAEVVIWDVDAQKEIRRLRDERLIDVKDLAWSPDGKKLATTGGGTRTLWDVPTGRLIDKAAEYRMNAVAWSPNGELLASVGRRETVLIWPAEHTARPRLIAGAETFDWGATGAFFVTSRGKQITVWDSYRWRKISTLDQHQQKVTALCLNSDERLIASADEGRNLYVWDRATGKQRWHKSVDGPPLVDLAFSPDRKWLSGMHEHKEGEKGLRVWSMETLEEVKSLPSSHQWHAWSPDSRYLLTGDLGTLSGGERYRGRYLLWDANKRKTLSLSAGWYGRSAGAWSSNGAQLVLTTYQGYDIGIYDVVGDANPRVQLSSQGIINAAHGNRVKTVDWSSTGRRIISVGVEKRARVWDVETMQPVHEIENVLDARWGPFGVRIAVRTPEGVEIRDASIGAARGRWKQLLPLLKRQQELGRITAEDLRAMVEIHVHHEQWKQAQDAVAALQKLDPDDPRSRRCAAETYTARARALIAVGRHDEARRLLRKSRDACLELLFADPKHLGHVRRSVDAMLALTRPVAQAKWAVVTPIEMKSSGGARLATLSDGSIRASGNDVRGDTYTISGTSPAPEIRALRLEALPDGSLPKSGPGRHPSGNFQLQELRLLAPLNGNDLQLVPIADAWASYEFRRSNVKATIDYAKEVTSGKDVWHVFDRPGKRHVAVYVFKQPLRLGVGSKLAVVLKHRAVSKAVNLGRFRISVSEDLAALQRERRHSALEELADPWPLLGALALEACRSDDDAREAAQLLGQLIDSAPNADAKAQIVEQAAASPDVFAALAKIRPNDPQLVSHREIGSFRKAIKLDAANAQAHNGWAWLLVRSPTVAPESAADAVKLAKRGCGLDPKKWNHWTTLGVAHYRAGDWRSALAALQMSESLHADRPANALFLAMSHWRLDDKPEAGKWHAKASAWRAKNKPDAELQAFYSEAEKLLGN